jgi:hypothetical protein
MRSKPPCRTKWRAVWTRSKALPSPTPANACWPGCGALQDPDAARIFEGNFKSLQRLWEAVSPDPCLHPHRYVYNWLCGIYVAYRRRQRGSRDTLGELSAKTQALIEANTAFMDLAEALPVFRIDQDYVTHLGQLPTPADKAAALEALLTAELAEDDPNFTYRQLGERLQRIKERKDAADQAAEDRLRELQDIADELAANAQRGTGSPESHSDPANMNSSPCCETTPPLRMNASWPTAPGR